MSPAEQNQSGTLLYRMTHAPVVPLILRLGIPTTISMLITALYNTAGTFYVKFLGTSAVGAMGIIFALMTIIQACGFWMGQGGASQISRLLGARDYDQANKVSSSALLAGLVLGLIVAVLGNIFLVPLMKILGATPTILPYATACGGIILAAAPMMCGALALNNLLRAEGLAFIGMLGLTSGGLLNIAIAPLFIFVFDWGMAGAGWAMFVSQSVSFIILLSHYLRGKGTVKLSFASVSRTADVYYSIVRNGLPSLTRQSLGTVAAAALNLMAGVYGDAAVAAMTTVGRVILITNAFMVGIGQGYQPVLGYNWGARCYSRVYEAMMATIKMGTGIMIVMGGLGFIFAPQIVGLFETNEPAVMVIGIFSLKMNCLVSPFIPMNIMGNMTFQVLGRTKIATFLASIRQGIFFLPLVWGLPFFIGLTGVQIAQPLAETLSFFVSSFFLWQFIQQIKGLIRDKELRQNPPLK